MTMRIDHFGYVVSQMEDAKKQFIDCYSYKVVVDTLYDPEQHVFLCMLTSNNHFVELIQPVDETSPSFDFLNKGGGLHHICYAVPDITQAIHDLKVNKHLLFKAPVDAVLFGGKKVAFLYNKLTKQIIELVEK